MKTNKLRLWVDCQCLQTLSRMRGIGRYVQEFVAEVAENRPDVDLHVSLNAALPQQAVAARDLLQKWVNPSNIHIWHGVAEGPENVYGYTKRRELSEIALRYHVSDIAPHVALSASPFEEGGATPLLPGDTLDVPIASIFYDAIPLRFPKQYLKNQRVIDFYQRRLEAHKGFGLNLCISDFSRNELFSLLGKNNSVNIGAGTSKDFLRLVTSDSDVIREPNTLLYVGGYDWRKNVPRVLEAVSYLEGNLRDELKLILVGDIDKLVADELSSQWLRYGLPTNNLRLVGHVSDHALVRYYQSVSAVIQPSLMEGFGLTALEAILSNTPVIASKEGALPEIIRDDRRLFDPNDVADIATHIQKVLKPERSEDHLSAEAMAHAQGFTWKRTVDVAVNALRNFVEEKHGDTLQPVERDKAVVNSLSALKLPLDIKAGCISRAQKPIVRGPRLIVDATATVISNAGTGIQRVVTRICRHIADDRTYDAEPVVAFSTSEDAWYVVPNGDLNSTPAHVIEHNETLFLSNNDHVLMLDSSWAFYPQHTRTLTYGRLRGCEVTTCLYDLVPLRASGFCSSGMPDIFSRWFKAALGYSTGFVCISKAVADELIILLEGIDFPKPMKIGYWPLGADFAFEPRQPVNLTASKRTKTFLMVGTIEPRKGHRVALDAFDLLWSQGVDIQLTIVGKLGWNALRLIERMRSHPEWNKRLVWKSHTTDEELQNCYANADCLIASSFAEGFGLPIVEAGHFGKPVIASDIPVFREVAGKSPFSQFFEVGNGRALAQTIERFIVDEDRTENATLIESPWENWSESASSLKDVVLNRNWYHLYEPKEPRSFASINEAIDIRMTRPILASDRKFQLSIEDGPLAGENSAYVYYVVKVVNDTSGIWSSNGTTEGLYGINLAARLFNGSGQAIEDGPRAQIPFILAPKDSIYLPVEVPEAWRANADMEVRIEIVQEGVDWWGGAIKLPIGAIQ